MRSLQSLHDRAVWCDGRDCSCALDPDTCEAMAWAKRLAARPPADGQLELGANTSGQVQAGDPWPDDMF